MCFFWGNPFSRDWEAQRSPRRRNCVLYVLVNVSMPCQRPRDLLRCFWAAHRVGTSHKFTGRPSSARRICLEFHEGFAWISKGKHLDLQHKCNHNLTSNRFGSTSTCLNRSKYWTTVSKTPRNGFPMKKYIDSIV